MTTIKYEPIPDWQVAEQNAHDDWFFNQYPQAGRLINNYGLELMHEMGMVQGQTYAISSAAWMERARLARADSGETK